MGRGRERWGGEDIDAAFARHVVERKDKCWYGGPLEWRLLQRALSRSQTGDAFVCPLGLNGRAPRRINVFQEVYDESACA